MQSILRVMWRQCAALAAFAVVILTLPTASEASPITFQFTGTVVQTNFPALLGSQATILLITDPDANLCPVAGCTHPITGSAPMPNTGMYAFQASIDFAGLHYDESGYFLVNWWSAGPFPGILDMVGERSMWTIGTSDPASAALPTPITFDRYFLYNDTVIGNVQPVPEPGTWLLLSTGLLAVAARWRLKGRKQGPTIRLLS